MKNNNKYIFKYDQNGELYNYVEINKFQKIISFFKLEGKKLIRFDRISQKKELVKFKNSVRLKQRFISGESFISIFDVEKDECIQHNMPEKEKCITLIKNNISVHDYGKYVIERWKSINKNNDIYNQSNTIKTSIQISSKLPSELNKTIKSTFAQKIGFYK